MFLSTQRNMISTISNIDVSYCRTNGDPPARALHTIEEICNCKWYNRPKYFNGTLDAFVKIGKTEGISSLWSGLSPTLVLAVPTTMIYFTAYEQLKCMLNAQYLKVGFGSVKLNRNVFLIPIHTFNGIYDIYFNVFKFGSLAC